jgi:hypothetical protein
LNLGEELRRSTLAAYDRMIALQLDQLAADGCLTKAPCGGACAGKSPLDQAKQGTKRSGLTDAYGIPLITDPAPAGVCDHTLLPATCDQLPDLEKIVGSWPEHPALSLDAAYDYRVVHEDLAGTGIIAKIAKRGVATPIQADGRWVVGGTNSWVNNFGRLRRCTERRQACVVFFIALASAIITVRSLIRRAWFCYRWDARPRSPRIR